MTVADFARLIGVSARSVWKAARDGRLRGFATLVKNPGGRGMVITDVDRATEAWQTKVPPGHMLVKDFARHLGISYWTVDVGIRAGRLDGFVTWVSGPGRIRGRAITDIEGASAAWRNGTTVRQPGVRSARKRSSKPRQWTAADAWRISRGGENPPAWYGRPECYDLKEGHKTLNLRRLSSKPALASRWIDEIEYPEDVQRPCRRGDCAPAGTCPHCQASPVAPRVNLPAGEGEDTPARLLCPRCGGEIRWGGAEGARRWEKPNPGEPTEDARGLPAAVLATCRPCPFVSCRKHMAFDVEKLASLTFTTPGVPIWEMPQSCSLDEADAGEVGLERLAALMGRSYDRSFQLVDEALFRAREVAEGMDEEEGPGARRSKRGRPSTLAAIPSRSATAQDWRGTSLRGYVMPELPPLPYRRPSPEEVARLYPGAAISVEYGQPRPQPTGLGDPPHEGEPTARFWAADQDRAIKGWRVRFALDREKRHRQQAEARHQDEGF